MSGRAPRAQDGSTQPRGRGAGQSLGEDSVDAAPEFKSQGQAKRRGATDGSEQRSGPSMAVTDVGTSDREVERGEGRGREAGERPPLPSSWRRVALVKGEGTEGSTCFVGRGDTGAGQEPHAILYTRMCPQTNETPRTYRMPARVLSVFKETSLPFGCGSACRTLTRGHSSPVPGSLTSLRRLPARERRTAPRTGPGSRSHKVKEKGSHFHPLPRPQGKMGL